MAYISKVKLPDNQVLDIKDSRLVLDNNNKIATQLLPDFILGQMLYGGTWNANSKVATLSTNAKTKLDYSANTLTLVTGSTGTGGYVKNEGIYYIASASGTFATETYEVGDWLVATSAGWKKIDNTDAVASVNGKTGVVNLTYSDVDAMSEDAGLNDLSDVVVGNPSNGQVLTYNGSAWVNSTHAAGTLTTSATTSQTAMANESLSGNVILHKVSKTGKLNDLVDVDLTSTGVAGNVMIVDSSLSARTTPVYIHTDGTVELPESKGIQFVADQNDTIYTTLVPNNSAPRDGNTVTVPAVDGTILTDYSTVSSAYGLSFSASQEEVKYNTTDNKLYVDKTIFEGTITYNNGTYTCDKTYAQLLDAYQKGQVVRVKYSYQVDDLSDMCGLYYLSNVENINSDPELVFTLSDPTNFQYTPPTEFTVISNNTWSSRTVMPLTNANVGTIPTSSGYTEVKYSTADGKLYSAASPETAIGSLNTTFSGSQATSASESFGGTINLHKVSKTGRMNDLVDYYDFTMNVNLATGTVTSASKTPAQVFTEIDNYPNHHFYCNLTDENGYMYYSEVVRSDSGTEYIYIPVTHYTSSNSTITGSSISFIYGALTASTWSVSTLDNSKVSGTTSGDNWTTITINGTTKNIPQGGGSDLKTFTFELTQSGDTYDFYSNEVTPSDVYNMITSGYVVYVGISFDMNQSGNEKHAVVPVNSLDCSFVLYLDEHPGFGMFFKANENDGWSAVLDEGFGSFVTHYTLSEQSKLANFDPSGLLPTDWNETDEYSFAYLHNNPFALSAATNGQIIKYDASVGKWVNVDDLTSEIYSVNFTKSNNVITSDVDVATMLTKIAEDKSSYIGHFVSASSEVVYVTTSCSGNLTSSLYIPNVGDSILLASNCDENTINYMKGTIGSVSGSSVVEYSIDNKMGEISSSSGWNITTAGTVTASTATNYNLTDNIPVAYGMVVKISNKQSNTAIQYATYDANGNATPASRGSVAAWSESEITIPSGASFLRFKFHNEKTLPEVYFGAPRYTSTDTWVQSMVTIPSGGGGATALSGLTDTTITTPTNGQVLTYDSTTQKWINANAGGGSSSGLSYLTVDTLYRGIYTTAGTYGDIDYTVWQLSNPTRRIWNLQMNRVDSYDGQYDISVDTAVTIYDGMIIYSQAEDAFYVYKSGVGIKAMTEGHAVIDGFYNEGDYGYYNILLPKCNTNTTLFLSEEYYTANNDLAFAACGEVPASTDYFDIVNSTHTLTIFNPLQSDIDFYVDCRGADTHTYESYNGDFDLSNGTITIPAGKVIELSINIGDRDSHGMPIVIAKNMNFDSI